MDISSTYTTQEKITADKEGIEIKKVVLSNDAYAISEIIELLIKKIEHIRIDLI